MATIKGNSGNNNLTGTTENDFIYGYDGLDTLTGLAGNDRLEAGNGNDILDGGSGADTMIGGNGDDTYIIDRISDVIIEIPGEGVDTIKTSISYTMSDNYVNNLILTGNSNLNGTGNSYDNVITGNNGKNILKGGDGNDTIYGYVDDTLYGEKGDDYLTGGSYIDGDATIYGGEGNDTVSGFGVMYGNAGNDLLTPGEYSTAYGGIGNDTLTGYQSASYGEGGNDLITGFQFYGNGGNGNDTLKGGDFSFLEGGKGEDTLICYKDYDTDEHTIIFNASNEGIDTIIDFDPDTDSLQVSASGFGGITAGVTISSTQFKYGISATTSSQRFIYDTATGYLRFDIDGSGSTSATVLAIFQGAPTLNNSDINVI
ncbi:hypothetical protein C7H19_22560 [Aphanothece hegewaldii CCALA 016]|uniref:Calcium-binding protein n=1 Tax=Aphanothece hegewaldii CCALA 016 TaxID=2107694 RepID=A0A2T1LRR3_9CHRO|nr:calcium-binding protein [Aphanothece hegewaldii]PSF31432.1 hypothetical protein C7H19_22560 [Aphanothece hegewaldii CCALA 016]